MSPEFVLSLGKDALMVAFQVAAPPLVFGLIVGLTVSIFQAVTQVQDMTLTFLPKIIAGAIAFGLFGPWMLNKLLSYTAGILGNLQAFIK
jgi:flagellar biosynthetic protein FliQ